MTITLIDLENITPTITIASMEEMGDPYEITCN